MIHPFCDLGHDTQIGDYASIEAYCFFGGYSEMGSESIMHVRSHLLPHKKVGNKAVVGASSVVIRNVPDGQHVIGNPAKKIEY
jgi:UDP-3-O-[3-hydroxymyristoyl] glucosamine N-acyltransferase